MKESQPVWKVTHETARTFKGISVLYGGRQGGALAEHSHPELQVSVHFRGVSKNGVRASHVNVFASKQPHVGGWKQGDEIVVLQLSELLIAETRNELSRGVNCDVIPANKICDAVLEGLGYFVRDEFQKPGKLGDFLIESVGYIAARHLIRVHSSDGIADKPANALSASELRTVRQYVAENLQQGFSAGQLAATLKLRPVLFAEKLKVSTGLSPWRYVQNYRIDAAKVLLHHQQKPIAEVAEELGFADQSHFTNFFRVATGLTPKAYRSRL